MRVEGIETPTYSGAAGTRSGPAVAERLSIRDREDNEVGFINRAVDGTFTAQIGGQDVLLAGAGTVILDLPTSDPEVAGQLWSDEGIVTVSEGPGED